MGRRRAAATRTLTTLHAYAARVAGTVGAMMTVLMGRARPDVLARACDLGVAMQLTNIARDVGEDARAGRSTCRCDWLREAGIDPDAWLARPRLHAGARRASSSGCSSAADALYARADDGIAMLPPACRPGIRAARLLYAEIGARDRARAARLGLAARGGARAAQARARARALLPRAVGATAHPPLAAAAPLLREVPS